MDPSAVLHALSASLSDSDQLRQAAYTQLNNWEQQPGFTAILLSLVEKRDELNHQQRLLAVIYAKNAIHRRWNPSYGNSIGDDEKEVVKNALVSLLGQEVDAQVVTQLALIIGEVSEYEFPERWGNVVPLMLSTLPNDTKLRETALIALHRIVKGQVKKSKLHEKKMFHAFCAEMISHILPLWDELFRRSLSLMEACTQKGNTELDSDQKLLLSCTTYLEKITYRVLLFGFPKPHLEGSACILYRGVLERCSTYLRCVQALFPSFSSASGLTIHAVELEEKEIATRIPFAWVLRSCLRNFKYAISVQRNYPLLLGSVASLTESGIGCASEEEMEKRIHTVFDTVKYAIIGDHTGLRAIGLDFYAFLLKTPAYAQHCGLACAEKEREEFRARYNYATSQPTSAEGAVVGRAISTYFTKTMVEEIYTLLMTHVFPLRDRDVEEWEVDPEQFSYEFANAHTGAPSDGKYGMDVVRKSGDMLFTVLIGCAIHHFVDMFVQDVSKYCLAVALKKVTAEQKASAEVISRRDALVRVIGTNVQKLAPFIVGQNEGGESLEGPDQFLMAMMDGEFGIDGCPPSKIVLNRLGWLLGMIADKGDVFLPDPPVTAQFIMGFLTYDDLAVRITGAGALRRLSAYIFDDEKGFGMASSFAADAAQSLIATLKETEGVETRWMLLSIMGNLLDQDTDRSISTFDTSSFLHPLCACLVELWQSTSQKEGDALLLRGAVIDLLNNITLRIGRKMGREEASDETIQVVTTVFNSIVPICTAIVRDVVSNIHEYDESIVDDVFALWSTILTGTAVKKIPGRSPPPLPATSTGGSGGGQSGASPSLILECYTFSISHSLALLFQFVPALITDAITAGLERGKGIGKDGFRSLISISETYTLLLCTLSASVQSDDGGSIGGSGGAGSTPAMAMPEMIIGAEHTMQTCWSMLEAAIQEEKEGSAPILRGSVLMSARLVEAVIHCGEVRGRVEQQLVGVFSTMMKTIMSGALSNLVRSYYLSTICTAAVVCPSLFLTSIDHLVQSGLYPSRSKALCTLLSTSSLAAEHVSLTRQMHTVAMGLAWMVSLPLTMVSEWGGGEEEREGVKREVAQTAVSVAGNVVPFFVVAVREVRERCQTGNGEKTPVPGDPMWKFGYLKEHFSIDQLHTAVHQGLQVLNQISPNDFQAAAARVNDAAVLQSLL
mmetsp:Transcript_30724/g.80327  ORF Transcript_30724/g.80327 Transcript_30724/m.80327 type:complete len:1180 (-) Transcript_30724:144-3683(-)